jgi:hypothetical protein
MKTILQFDYENRSDIEILDTGDGFTVICGDYVANVWEEKYPTLSLALLRVAVLVKCGEHEFEKLFAKDVDTFARSGVLFLNGEVI